MMIIQMGLNGFKKMLIISLFLSIIICCINENSKIENKKLEKNDINEIDSLLKLNRNKSKLELNINFETNLLKKELIIEVFNKTNNIYYTSANNWIIANNKIFKNKVEILKSINNTIFLNNDSNYSIKGGIISASPMIAYKDSILNILSFEPYDTTYIHINLSNLDNYKELLKCKYLHLTLNCIDSSSLDYLNENIEESLIYKKINIISKRKYKLDYLRDSTYKYKYDTIKFTIPFVSNNYYFLISRDSILKSNENN